MEPIAAAIRRPRLEPLAPVMGGGRWRTRYHDLFDLYRRDRGFVMYDPDVPERDGVSPPEPERLGACRIVSSPPEEARVGSEYWYHARAFDSGTDGFTWYFEKCAPGMAVDRHSGRVVWTPGEGGYVEVVLCARSVFGAVSRQCWTVCVRKAAAVHRVSINQRYSEALSRKKARERLRPVRTHRRCGGRRYGGRLATAPPEARRRAALPLRC